MRELRAKVGKNKAAAAAAARIRRMCRRYIEEIQCDARCLITADRGGIRIQWLGDRFIHRVIDAVLYCAV